MTAFDAGRLSEVDALTLELFQDSGTLDVRILDPDGGRVAFVRSGGSGFGGGGAPRRLGVFDGADGRLLFQVQDPPNLGRDKLQVLDADGLPLAAMRRDFALLQLKLTVHVVDGTVFVLTGGLTEAEVQAKIDDHAVAGLASESVGFLDSLRGNARRSLWLHRDMPAVVRCAVLGAVLARELIAGKEREERRRRQRRD